MRRDQRQPVQRTAIPRQRRWRPRWLTNREGVEFAVLDHLDRHVSRDGNEEGQGRKATKRGAHHRHRTAGSKPLPRTSLGWLALRRKAGKRRVSR